MTVGKRQTKKEGVRKPTTEIFLLRGRGRTKVAVRGASALANLTVEYIYDGAYGGFSAGVRGAGEGRDV